MTEVAQAELETRMTRIRPARLYSTVSSVNT